jgi:hypothetical protein
VHDLFAPPADAPWAAPAAALVRAQNASLATARRGTWNWTAADRVALIAVDRTVPLEDEVAIVHVRAPMSGHYACAERTQGRIEVADSRRDDELVFFFEAVHFIANGTLYGLAEPNRCVVWCGRPGAPLIAHVASARTCGTSLRSSPPRGGIRPRASSRPSSARGSTRRSRCSSPARTTRRARSTPPVRLSPSTTRPV